MALYVPISLTVTNSATNAPIAGANVFINGTLNFDPNQFSVSTNSSGNASFQCPSNLGNQVMQITATGFQNPNPILINTVLLSPQSIQVSMTPAPVMSAIVSVQFVPNVAGIVWQIVQGVTTVYNGITVDGGTDQTTTPIANGNYTISATLSGYQALTQSVTLNGQASPYTFTLIQDPDATSAQQGNTNGDSSASTTQSASTVSQTIDQAPSSEYVYPNTDYDKYFTITGARIYIGNTFIDECYSIQYALQDNALPVYGYASRFIDAFAQGRSLVQGQLTLNFVTEGYLYTVLRTYKQLLGSTLGTGTTLSNPASDAVTQTLGLMAQRDTYAQPQNGYGQPASNTSLASAYINTPRQQRAAALQTQITNNTNAMTASQINSLNSQRQQQTQGTSDIISYDNGVYQDVVFDLRVEMGNAVTGVKRVRYLEKCKLISNEQVIAPDGQTILDAYGFIARRLR